MVLAAATRLVSHRRFLLPNSVRFGKQAIAGYHRSSLLTVHVNVISLPALSPTMTHGTITGWQKKPGESFGPGDVLCEVETDKASMGFELQDEGVLAKLLIGSNSSELKVGTPIALSVEDDAAYQLFLKEGGDYDSSAVPAPVAPPAAVASTATNVATATISAPHSTGKPSSAARLSPATRHMIHSKSIDVASLHGTGKGGMVSKADVVLAIKSGTARTLPPSKSTSQQPATAATATAAATNQQTATSPPSLPQIPTAPSATWSSLVSSEPVNTRFVDIPNNNMRKVIAKRLTESKATVPHFYSIMECEVDALLALRKQLKRDMDLNVSVNDFVVRASALALRDLPNVNAKWNKAKESAEASAGVDISVAVATPNGLITPIVAAADKKGVASINSAIKDLAGRARAGKLKPEEYQGGSFSVSNLGMYGISHFSAVINPPQACILAVGTGVSRILPPANNSSSGKPRVVTTVSVQLSADRRVVDEAEAAEFLQVFRNYLSNPSTLLL